MRLISVQSKSNGSVEIKIDDNRLISRNSIGKDDRNQALMPVELLSSALGSCICLMIDEFCRKNGYIDGSTALYLTYQIGGAPKQIEVITIDIELPRDFLPEKQSDIRKIIETCPIHATLANPPRIDIDIVS